MKKFVVWALLLIVVGVIGYVVAAKTYRPPDPVVELPTAIPSADAVAGFVSPLTP